MILVTGSVEFSEFERFADRIRASSNFRVTWQLFQCDASCKATPRTARQVLDTICMVPEYQRFLADDLSPLPIESASAPLLHEHCAMVPVGGSFEETLARGAADRLGAYSRSLANAIASEVEEVRALFGVHGVNSPFELRSGDVPGCSTCAEHNGHLFSDWFYAVAWDWCFCVVWESRKLALVWCMTDTD
jgi:hypothetical protein